MDHEPFARMNYRLLLSYVLLILVACQDRLNYDVPLAPVLGIVVDGQITDQPGPYSVTLSTEYDLESKESLRQGIIAKQVTLFDDLGNSESFIHEGEGNYRSQENGMRGAVGRAYKLRIELLDGRLYESRYDTIYPPGNLSNLTHEFSATSTLNGSAEYGFDIKVKAGALANNANRFIYKFKGTFQSDTNPELMCPVDEVSRSQCEPCGSTAPCPGCNKCNLKPLCSGIRNYGNVQVPKFERIGPCECCRCWYDIFNATPVLSREQAKRTGTVEEYQVYRIPLNRWMFQHKVYVEVQQVSLSAQAMKFWRAIETQNSALGSLFQPVTGKIPNLFDQLSGPAGRISGVFFAGASISKNLFITRDDVPAPITIPNADELPWKDSCLKLFPNSTTTRPPFWVD